MGAIRPIAEAAPIVQFEPDLEAMPGQVGRGTPMPAVDAAGPAATVGAADLGLDCRGDLSDGMGGRDEAFEPNHGRVRKREA